MKRLTRGLRVAVGLALGSVLLSGCDFDVYSLPLPGGTDVGDDPIEVTVQFQDVLDLVPNSTVKVADVSVGKVEAIRLDGQHAEVSLVLREDVELPDNAVAEIRQTSLLGEKFVSLSAPETGASDSELGDGDVIPLERSGRNPEVEEVLGALSLVLNGGGVAQLKTIAQELNKALTGREDDVKSVLTQIDTFTETLDTNKAQIVNAIEALNRLALAAREQRDDIDLALDELPSALLSIDSQRQDLVRMLEGLSQLSDVGVRVISASKDATIDSLRQLQPVLNQLAASGDDFVNAFNVFYAYPFVDEVVGRDPTVARNLHMGDYTNLSIQLELDFSQGLPTPPGVPTVVCTELSEIPDAGPLPPLDELCEGAVDAINQCLQSPSEKNCAGLPNFLVDQVCDKVAVPGLCPGAGGGGGVPGVPLPSVSIPGVPPLGGVLGALNRGGVATPSSSAPDGPTMAQLQAAYDPALVSLLVPGLVAPAAGDDGTDTEAGGTQ